MITKAFVINVFVQDHFVCSWGYFAGPSSHDRAVVDCEHVTNGIKLSAINVKSKLHLIALVLIVKNRE